jgi:hypothetical protein
VRAEKEIKKFQADAQLMVSTALSAFYLRTKARISIFNFGLNWAFVTTN